MWGTIVIYLEIGIFIVKLRRVSEREREENINVQ